MRGDAREPNEVWFCWVVALDILCCQHDCFLFLLMHVVFIRIFVVSSDGSKPMYSVVVVSFASCLAGDLVPRWARGIL